MALGKEVGLGAGHIVLAGDPAPQKVGTAAPRFSAHADCGQTVAHLSNCWAIVYLFNVKHQCDPYNVSSTGRVSDIVWLELALVVGAVNCVARSPQLISVG